MIQTFDERRQFVIPGDAARTLDFCIEHFLTAYHRSIQEKNRFLVALSGGSTPKALFARLTASPLAQEIDWNLVHLFWSDERSVPPDHQDSNFHMAMKAGFDKVPIPPSQIHRMHAEEEIEKNAKAYETLLLSLDPPGSLDYLMLGMGEDGHTASLFPGTEALKESQRLVVANYVPAKQTWRMTLTLPCLNLAKTIVLYVLGKEKRERIRKIFLEKDLDPSALVGTHEHKALWILDEEAGKDLLRG